VLLRLASPLRLTSSLAAAVADLDPERIAATKARQQSIGPEITVAEIKSWQARLKVAYAEKARAIDRRSRLSEEYSRFARRPGGGIGHRKMDEQSICPSLLLRGQGSPADIANS
jgi:hypothetical protein